MKKLNNGVSAIIGVILMVAITVAIAATVYVYVSGVIHSETPEDELLTITGVFNAISENGSIRINDTWYYFYDFDERYVTGIMGQTIRITYYTKSSCDYIDKIEVWE